ncbi:MAG: hypothetical protein E6Q95_02810 [Chitinophagaceae bacterium]|nr:MAG: hypothetical protein E6Q95_02810 [Chitinophagaceae bacterium]
MYKILFVFALLIVISIPSCHCRKEAVSSQKTLNDSAIAIVKDLYLWNDQVEKSDIDKKDFSDLSDLMKYVRNFSFETKFNRAVDQWSFAIKKNEWDKISSGIAGDFGVFVFFRNNADLRIRSVEQNSPAGKAGLKRGWQIVKINNSTDINTSDNSIDFILDALYESSSITLTCKKEDGTIQDYTLNVAEYVEKPILMDSIYNEPSGKIGYVVVSTFLGTPVETFAEYERVFTKFSTEGVKKLIVDLRYNSGGYIYFQQLLTNYLMPSSAEGKVMMQQVYNQKNSSSNSTTKVKKAGNLNIENICFLVTGFTASASELLINSIQPYYPNKFNIIGQKTEGKPVGYMGYSVGEYYIFPVSFKNVNANNEGDFYDGLDLNFTRTDGIDKNWGDKTENLLANALSLFNTNNPLSVHSTVERNAGLNYKANKTLFEKTQFKGAVMMK